MGQPIVALRAHAHKRVFRECDTAALLSCLPGERLQHSQAHGKQMLFGFTNGCWLSVHLGMAGRLFSQPMPYVADPHDHLVMETPQKALVYRDPRLFGRIGFEQCAELPAWWRQLPPEILSAAFDRKALAQFLQRRARSPIKAVLLMQERFPGLGNWMADEILWRAAIHPAMPSGDLQPRQVTRLFKEIKAVCADALEVIGTDWSPPPDSWLFNHRWKAGGRCPKTGKPLQRDTIGGRTSCWSPARQRLPAGL